MEALVGMILRKETVICPWCGGEITCKESEKEPILFCNKCSFEMDSNRVDILAEIKKRKDELENIHSDYLLKEEHLRRLCTLLSIGSMKVRTPQSQQAY